MATPPLSACIFLPYLPHCLPMAKKKGKQADGGSSSGPRTPRIRNRRAFREYAIVERVEAGLVLTGTEVKSLRGGKCQIDEAYGRLTNGEVFLVGADIAIYAQAVGTLQHDPKRVRKCLLHRHQIATLLKHTAQKGMTIVPLAVYFRNGFAKVELGIGKGKQDHDKRETIKRRQAERDMNRQIRDRR